MVIQMLYNNDNACLEYLRTHLPHTSNRSEVWNDITRLYDNLRPSYSLTRHLEFGGIVMGIEEIEKLIATQVNRIVETYSPTKITIVWSMTSASLYVQSLSINLRRFGISCELLGVRTSWKGELDVRIIEHPLYCANDGLIVCADFMIGTGCTFRCLHEYLRRHGVVPNLNVVLVSLLQEARIYNPVLLDPFIELAENPWVIGYNADCLSEGVESGRELPFLAYLVPEGSGLRKKLMENQVLAEQCN